MGEGEVVDYMLKPERLFRATVRVWSGEPEKGGKLLGTAFFVAPRHALTAAHVVRGTPIETVYLQLSWKGGFFARVASVMYAEGRIDGALLEIDPGAAASIDSLVTVGQSLPADIGTPIRIVGFADSSSSVEIRPAAVTGFDARANAIIIDPPPAKGMSGGPALSPDGLLRGIIWARDQDRGRGYLTPISALRELLAQADLGTETAPARMLEYPALFEDQQRLALARKLLLDWRHEYSGQRDELKAAAKKARYFQRNRGGVLPRAALDIARIADSIVRAMTAIPIEALQFATHYGLAVHPSVFGGLAHIVITSARDRFEKAELLEHDEYAFELMARVLESAGSMLTYRPDALPQGFVEPIAAIDETAVATATGLLLARQPSSKDLMLIELNERPRVVGALVARSLDLRVDAARRQSDGTLEVVATDLQFRYRWSSGGSRPKAQYDYKPLLFAALPSVTPGASPVIGTSDGEASELYLDSSSSPLNGGGNRREWVAGALWNDPDEFDATYLLHLADNGHMRSVRLGREGLRTERSFDEVCEHPLLGRAPLSRFDSQIHLADVEGFPCAMIIRHSPQWRLVLCVHPVSLKQIVPLRRLDGKFLNFTVAGGRWLVASHYGVKGGEALLSVYDLTSDMERPTAKLEYSGTDTIDVLSICTRKTGRDAFEIWFVQDLLYPGSGQRLCRWLYPDSQFDEFPDLKVSEFFSVEL